MDYIWYDTIIRYPELMAEYISIGIADIGKQVYIWHWFNKRGGLVIHISNICILIYINHFFLKAIMKIIFA